jgi:nitroreductase
MQTKINYPPLMQERVSCRSFTDEPLSPLHRKALQSFIDEPRELPFGSPVRFILIDKNPEDLSSENRGGAAAGSQGGARLGTYGVIRGAGTFIAGMTVSEGDDQALEDYGYAFEQVILFAESLGLGTCWLGGTFNRGGFAAAAVLEKGEIIPCVSPVGYPSGKRSLVERVMRTAARSSKRKPWNELFFTKSFNHPLKKETVGDFEEALRMVQVAPSASNKQPWRIVFDPGSSAFHFYMHTLAGYAGNKLGFKIQRIDMGIAMFHFAQTAVQAGFAGTWTRKDPGIFIPHYPNGQVTYFATWHPVNSGSIGKV